MVKVPDIPGGDGTDPIEISFAQFLADPKNEEAFAEHEYLLNLNKFPDWEQFFRDHDMAEDAENLRLRREKYYAKIPQDLANETMEFYPEGTTPEGYRWQKNGSRYTGGYRLPNIYRPVIFYYQRVIRELHIRKQYGEDYFKRLEPSEWENWREEAEQLYGDWYGIYWAENIDYDKVRIFLIAKYKHQTSQEVMMELYQGLMEKQRQCTLIENYCPERHNWEYTYQTRRYICRGFSPEDEEERRIFSKNQEVDQSGETVGPF
tara:strand:+ start:880 stop:1665 length:786 start_codon:yes stop_codon:yes gene_type:complete